jgi:hypothetical protein
MFNAFRSITEDTITSLWNMPPANLDPARKAIMREAPQMDIPLARGFNFPNSLPILL